MSLVEADKKRTWPILAAGFGSLLVLIGLLGLGAHRRAAQIHRQISAVHEAFQHTEELLSELQLDFYLSNILVRDLIADASGQSTSGHPQRLIEIRASMSEHLEELQRGKNLRDSAMLRQLRSEVETYWSRLEPMFSWGPLEKSMEGSHFLEHVLPKLDAVLTIAAEIQDLNEVVYRQERENVAASEREFQDYLARITLLALITGLGAAAVSIFRSSRLERRAELQRQRTERAEQELRLLSHQLVRAQERERKSISRELHDEVGQMLTALRMELGNLEEFRLSDGHQFQEHLSEARDITRKTINAVRDLAMGLRPSILDDLGLPAAIEWQAHEFSRRSGVPVTVSIDGDFQSLSDTESTCAYRVVQEALTNCARHAQATSIQVGLRGDRNTLTLSVEDNGVGFRRETSSSQGLGLVGIEERIRELGGKVSISSKAGEGTQLIAEIPLRQEAS
ncbi:MAG: sensor histidine kinase [Acidobacteriota bacterium]